MTAIPVSVPAAARIRVASWTTATRADGGQLGEDGVELPTGLHHPYRGGVGTGGEDLGEDGVTVGEDGVRLGAAHVEPEDQGRHLFAPRPDAVREADGEVSGPVAAVLPAEPGVLQRPVLALGSQPVNDDEGGQGERPEAAVDDADGGRRYGHQQPWPG
jgi:hypothetical protein